MYTPYQFAGNKPINSIDLDGLEEFEINNGNLDINEKAEFKGRVMEWETSGNGFTTGTQRSWEETKSEYNLSRYTMGYGSYGAAYRNLYDRYESYKTPPTSAPEGSLESISFSTQFYFSKLYGYESFTWKGGRVGLGSSDAPATKGLMQSSQHQNTKDVLGAMKLAVSLALFQAGGGFAYTQTTTTTRFLFSNYYVPQFFAASAATDAAFQIGLTGELNLAQSATAGICSNPAAAIAIGNLIPVTLSTSGFSFKGWNINDAGSQMFVGSIFGTGSSALSKYINNIGGNTPQVRAHSILSTYYVPFLSNVGAEAGNYFIGNLPGSSSQKMYGHKHYTAPLINGGQ